MARPLKLQARQVIASKKHSVVREEILNAAVQLFAERGYRAVSMDDVAAALQYTKSVIYYYFKNKNEILWQIYVLSSERYSADIQPLLAQEESSAVKLRRMIRVHAMNVMNHRDWTAVYNNESSELTASQRQALNRMNRDYDAMFESVFQRGVAEGVFREIPVHVAVGGILGMCNWLQAWYNDKGPLSSEQIADFFANLLEHGYSAGTPQAA